MFISFSPMRSDAGLTLSKTNTGLEINGQSFDFSGLLDGQTLSRDDISCDWFAADPYRDGAGQMHVSVILPYGPNPTEDVTFPATIEVQEDGPIQVPGA